MLSIVMTQPLQQAVNEAYRDELVVARCASVDRLRQLDRQYREHTGDDDPLQQARHRAVLNELARLTGSL